VGTNCLQVTGVDELHGCTFSMSDDHHEIATYLAIGAITGGKVRIKNRVQQHFPLLCQAFDKLGVQVVQDGEYLCNVNSKPYTVRQPITENTFQKIEAAPWPYFPADLLPPFIALSTACTGNVLFWNKVYEGGLSWIPELNKFGAFAHLCDPHKVIVIGGGAPLHAANVESPYIIRAAIALLMMALSVPGTSRIDKAVPITRAHPRFVENLRSLGAEVEWQ
jgi:UDP-N-acetylglucosamine 1-carboxyvinyltransferase